MLHYRTLRAPMSVQWELTEWCNNNCLHCYNHFRVGGCPKRRFASESEAHRIANQLIDNVVMDVTATGGEPFGNYPVLVQSAQELVSAGISYGINSNLTLATPSRMAELKQIGVRSILTSLLSSNEGVHDKIADRPGAYQETLRGIGSTLSAGIPLSVNMVVMKENFHDVYDTGKFVASLGVKSFSATKVSPAMNTRDFDHQRLNSQELIEVLDILLRLHEEFGISVDALECYPLCLLGDVVRFEHFSRRNCGAGVSTATIGADGTVRPCSHSDHVYGNVLETDFSDIWSRMSDWREARYIPEVCSDCQHLTRCTGGCRMEAEHYGQVTDLDPYATSPEAIISMPEKRQWQSEPVANSEQLTFSKGLLFRPEEFGSTLYTPRSGSLMINEDSTKLMQRAMELKTFTAESLQSSFPECDLMEIKQFLGALVESHLLYKTNGKKGD